MAISRRGVLIGTLVGGGLAIGYALRPRHFALPLEPGRDEVAFDAWIKIAADGMVSVAVPQVEMGQGVSTLIPQIVAVELGADWRQVAVEPAPLSALYANLPLAARWAPLWMPLLPGVADDPDDFVTRRWAEDNRFNATADGLSVAAYEAPARAAAASARAMLAQAAAARWNVAWEECEAKNGFITHEGKALRFGELAGEAAKFDPPATPPLRADPASENPQELPPGSALRFPRLDLPSKVDGTWLFAGDVRLPGMVYAAIRHAPIGMAELLEADPKKAAGQKGFLRIVKGDDWVAAVAANWWAAEKALDRIAPTFRFGDPADSDAADDAISHAMTYGPAHRLQEEGDATLVTGGLPVQIRYDISPALHASIETATATARYDNGRLELWVGTQAPEATRRAAARAAGLEASAVVLYPMPIGGSFDRRLEFGHAAQAARIAVEVGNPVQLVWSRREEHLAGLPRAQVAAVMGATPDTDGNIAGWRARIAVPAAFREFGQRLFDHETPYDARRAAAGKVDRVAVAGAEPPYRFRGLAVDHVPAAVPIPAGRMRGQAHGYTAFFNESFVDELAEKAGHEPLSFRMAMLGHDPRMADCLQRVAALADWDGGADASGQGMACHRIGEGRIAVVASARRDASGVRVDKLSAVADIGRIVNLDIARQQIEGGLIFGLGLALGCSTAYADGRPQLTRLGELGLPALADCPDVEVDFVTSDADPFDPGELGVAVVAPAVANALYSATGLRFRRLPLFADDL